MEKEILAPATPAKKSKEYKLILDNKTFLIKLTLSSDILFEINELEKIMAVFYSKSFSLEDLIQLSRGFRVCESIGDAFDILDEILEGKKAKIKNINENSITLIINVSLPGGRLQEVELDLNKKEMDKNTLIDNLVKKVNKLEEENAEIKNKLEEVNTQLNTKVNKLEEENKALKNEIKEINEKQKKFVILFEDEIKYKQIIQNIGVDSKIIKNKDETKFLLDRLKINFPNQNKINFKLLYRATKDGDNNISFHNKVDNKNSTLSIIETSKGLKFGVFLEIPFKGTEKSVQDDNCFIFRLDLRKIYNGKKGEKKLIDRKQDVLNLYYQPIYIQNNFLTNNSSYTCSKSDADNNFLGFSSDYELNNNEQFFTVKEMETFQICFD